MPDQFGPHDDSFDEDHGCEDNSGETADHFHDMGLALDRLCTVIRAIREIAAARHSLAALASRNTLLSD